MTRPASWLTDEAQELAASAGVRDAGEAIRRHARRLLDEHGDGSLPVRLSAFFPWAGVRKVRTEDISIEGGLRRLPDGRLDILVREDAARTRQRFSVAHELGHVLFHHHAPRAKARQLQMGTRAPQEEERLCNIAAAELLMPSAIVKELANTSDGLDRILRLIRTCDVSVEAAMLRMAPAWVGRGELQLWCCRDTWKQEQVCRLGETRGSLASFDVDQWGGQKTPGNVISVARAPMTLYSRTKRVRLSARTSVVQLRRRQPSLLILHEIMDERTHSSKTSLARAGEARVRRAWLTPASPQCRVCAGAGVLYPDPAGYPANRNDPPRTCSCRFDQPREGLSA
jgi:IrrE N-terminal-like domain